MGEAEAAAGDEKEKRELDTQQSGQMACPPCHTDFQELLPHTPGQPE